MSSHDDAAAQRFRELAAAYAGAVRRLCAVYARNAADREDLFQNILLAIWKALPAFRGESTERTWVYSIAHNVALTWQAKERRSTRAQLPLSEALDLPHTPTTDRRLLLYELIARLGPVDREVVVLWLEGLTAAEIGEVAGLTPGAVAVRLSRIRQSFAEALQISEARNG